MGRVRAFDTGPRLSLRRRLATLVAVAGPGIIVLVADNDAGSFSVYAQAGQNYGFGLLWLFLLLAPVLYVLQEMVARLGAVTGAGHARLIFERFGRRWGAFALGDLLALNLLTLVTEFIGIDFALEYLGVSRYISVPVAAAVLVLITSTGSLRNWERAMFVFVAGNLLVIPLLVYAHPHGASIARDTFVPGIAGGLTSTSVLLIIALVGTTVAPWQLFFQQSNVVDKRITTRWINYERADTILGSFVVVTGAAAIIITTAFAFGGTRFHGNFKDALHVANGLNATLGHTSAVLFSVVLLNASIIGAAAITLATSYAVGDVFGLRHSLNRPPREAKFFYGSFTAIVAAAAGIVLIPGAPLGVITVAVQALAGVLLPSASVFLLLLCNDREILGPWVNKLWLNVVATIILGALLMLSGILMVTTVFPHVNVTLLLIVLAGLLAVGLGVLGVLGLRGRLPAEPALEERRDTWTMKPIALLGRPPRSGARTVTMATMYLYVLVAIVLLAVKAAKLAGV